MTNQKLLAWLDGFSDYLDSLDYVFSNKDSQAFAQLRAMLHEPTDEERKEMLKHLDEVWGFRWDNQRYFQDSFNAIRALIMAPKRTVSRETEKADMFVRHIEKHLEVMRSYGSKVICKICGKTIDEIAELGITIDKGDVPVINEEGFSNEEKP